MILPQIAPGIDDEVEESYGRAGTKGGHQAVGKPDREVPRAAEESSWHTSVTCGPIAAASALPGTAAASGGAPHGPTLTDLSGPGCSRARWTQRSSSPRSSTARLRALTWILTPPVTLRSRVPQWLDGLTSAPTTRHHVQGRVTRHILSGACRHAPRPAARPIVIQAWLAGLTVGPAYARQVLADLSSILDAAVADGLIPRNPCKAATIRVPRAPKRKLVPWTRDQVAAVRSKLPERYRAVADAGAALGLRQGDLRATLR